MQQIDKLDAGPDVPVHAIQWGGNAGGGYCAGGIHEEVVLCGKKDKNK